jgi:hypothetical protein
MTTAGTSPIRFPSRLSFEANIEKYFPNDRPTLYAAEVFWYLNAGGTDPYTSVPSLADREFWDTRMPTVSRMRSRASRFNGSAAKSTGSLGAFRKC